MSPRPPDGAARFISKPGLGLRQPVITTDLERIAHQKGGPDTLTGEAGIGHVAGHPGPRSHDQSSPPEAMDACEMRTRAPRPSEPTRAVRH